MELHQVRYFLAVCDQLNFTRAAQKCHVTQPSLTRAIQLLEKEFGGFLFHRERANIRLTELGRVLIVASDERRLYDHLTAAFPPGGALNVRLDSSDRHVSKSDAERDRQHVDTMLRLHGLSIIAE